MNQRQKGAEDDFEKALKENSDFAEAYFALGRLRLGQGRPARRSALLEQALARDPDMLIALHTLVQHDVVLNNPAQARERIEAQIAGRPNNSQLYAMLAGLEMDRKNFSRANEAAVNAMQLAPASREAVSLYAQSAAGMGNPGRAIAAWSQWMAAHPRRCRSCDRTGYAGERKRRHR